MKTRMLFHLPVQKRIRVGIILVLVSILTIVPGYIQADNESESNQTIFTAGVIKKVYANGLTLLIKPNNDNDVVAINLLTRMGPLYEPPSQKGISSLMQRCLLYGGTTYRNLPTIYQELESVGAVWEYSSSFDYGNIWFKVTRPGLDKTLEVLIDIIHNPRFNMEDLKTGKNEKIQKIKTWGDQPFNMVSLVFSKSFYGDHPYSWLVEGSIESLDLIERDDLMEWYKKIYIPNNMVFTVVGNVNPDKIIKKFADAFGKMKKGKLPEKSSQPTPALDRDLVIINPKNIQGAYLFLGYPAPNVLSNDRPVMELINSIMSKRLYSELRDKRGLAYVIGSSYQQMVGPSNIFAIMVTPPEYYQVAREGIVNEFKRFCDEPVSSSELQAAKKYLKGSFVMSQETGAAQGRLLGIFELLGHGYKYADKYPELIEAVTPEDIQRVARKYFNYYVLAVVAPEGSIRKQ